MRHRRDETQQAQRREAGDRNEDQFEKPLRRVAGDEAGNGDADDDRQRPALQHRNDTIEVGTMIASDVPTQSGMRASSGTPVMRNTSYSTGMTIAPPPTPNRP